MDISSSPEKNKVLVTTSWDDGDILDMRLASLLERYGVKGTFYITKEYRKERVSDDGIRKLTRFHEIGAHSLTHPDLRAVSEEQKMSEMSGGKAWLEGVLGREVPMFCYPRGYYDEASIAAAKTAGFRGARTTKLGSVSRTLNPFEMDTTLQVYPFPFRKHDASHYYWGKLLEPYSQRAPALHALGVSTFSMSSWQGVARAAFTKAKEQNGVFHLWGHSWEIEKYNMWGELEDFLRYLRNQNDCAFVINSALIQ